MGGCWRADEMASSQCPATTGVSGGSEISLAACWARRALTQHAHQKGSMAAHIKYCESVHKTPTMDGFFVFHCILHMIF
jgi:hypothetical protein